MPPALTSVPAHAGPIRPVVVTGHLRTMDPACPEAEAMAVVGDIIVAVGGADEVRRGLPADTTVIAAPGTVVPGLIDAHVHTLVAGIESRRLTIDEATSVDDVLGQLRNWADANPDLDWIVAGAHFHAEDLAEGRLPNRHDLDRVCGQRPVFLDRRTHDAIVNSEALRRAGVDAATPDPDGGVIERDTDGAPTGVLVERPAAELVFDLIPDVDAAERDRALDVIQPRMHALGVTGAAEPGLAPAEMAAYQRAHAEGRLTVRTMAMPLADTDIDPADYCARLDGLGVTTGFGDDRLRLGPVKIYLDGTGGYGTALLSRPWPAAETDDYYGNLTCSADTFRSIVRHCAATGWSVAVHTVGDAAVALALDTFAEVNRTTPVEPLRLSVMHAYLWPSPASMEQAAALGVFASVQPSMQWRVAAGVARRFGPDDGAGTAPLRAWHDAGVTVAGGSDGPDFPMSPMFGMWQARTRTVRGLDEPLGPHQGVTAAEALAMYTVNSARYCFAEHRRGALRPGLLADWAALGCDPAVADADEVRDTPVHQTVVGGSVVHGDTFGLPAHARPGA